jgi:hypothetical protein
MPNESSTLRDAFRAPAAAAWDGEAARVRWGWRGWGLGGGECGKAHAAPRRSATARC